MSKKREELLEQIWAAQDTAYDLMSEYDSQMCIRDRAGTVFFAAVSWLAIAFFDAPLLRLFGARDALLPLAPQYLLPVKFVVPLFLRCV